MAQNPFPLEGQHALVTGGARGIGAAISLALLEQGAHLSVLGRDLAQLQAWRAALPPNLLPQQQIHLLQADVADAAQVQAAFTDALRAIGQIDILINNAGQAISAAFLKTDAELWQRMIAVNLTGSMHCIQQVLPSMLERKSGRIINIASTAGLVGYAYVSAYCAAKHGVLGLTRSLALEVARKGITVNAVCPGYCDTDIVQESIARVMQTTGRSQEQAIAEFVKGNPQQRLVQPQEVANTVLWLCSPGAAAITGQAISVSGGEVM